MSREKIPQSLVGALDSLCNLCPKAGYTETCPFRKLAVLSSGSRRSLFEDMDMGQVEALFDLVTDCACPKDPRAVSLPQRQPAY
jgi:hypothetical protein